MHVLQIVCFACGTCVLKTKLNRPGFFCATVDAGANSSGICHVVSRCSQIVVVIIASIAKLSLALSPVQNNMFLSRARKFMTKTRSEQSKDRWVWVHWNFLCMCIWLFSFLFRFCTYFCYVGRSIDRVHCSLFTICGDACPLSCVNAEACLTSRPNAWDRRGGKVNAALLSVINEACVNVCCATLLLSELVGSACVQARSSNPRGRACRPSGKGSGGGHIEWRCTRLYILLGF